MHLDLLHGGTMRHLSVRASWSPRLCRLRSAAAKTQMNLHRLGSLVSLQVVLIGGVFEWHVERQSAVGKLSRRWASTVEFRCTCTCVVVWFAFYEVNSQSPFFFRAFLADCFKFIIPAYVGRFPRDCGLPKRAMWLEWQG